MILTLMLMLAVIVLETTICMNGDPGQISVDKLISLKEGKEEAKKKN